MASDFAKGPTPKKTKFSGRTIGRMLSKKKNQGSEKLQLRAKNQLKPSGPDRFPDPAYPKYRAADGSPLSQED